MTTVSLVEDDSSFVLLWQRTLSKNKRIKIVSTHTTAEEALTELPHHKPDVVLMDIKLPGMNGIECLKRLLQIRPPLLLQVLMLTEYEDNKLVFEALKAGASGYLLKDRISVRDLAIAIKDVMTGGAVMSPNIARKVIRYIHEPSGSVGSLSDREMQVLLKLADGLMYKEIAGELSIALDTVRKHVGAIYSKLHVRSRAEATRQLQHHAR